MTTERLIILRSKNITTRTRDNMGPLAHPADGRTPAESIQVEEADLSKAERFDLRRNPEVQAVAPSMPMHLIEPVDSRDVDYAGTTNTWGVEAVKANLSPYDGSGITVAVLDTGIDPAHPSFSSTQLVQKNFTTESDNDLNGHGTHCAGTIFGGDVDGVRIGVARNISKALIGKVLGQGGGSSLTIARAIEWAIAGDANIISMSLGIDFPGYVDRLISDNGYNTNLATSMALEGYRANINLFSVLARYVQMQGSLGQGAIIIAASGNESKRPEYEIAVAPPAAGNGIVSVGALQESDSGLKVASFSNNQVDISAPGYGILSAATGGGLTSKSGTSMATPHVAGIAALWAQRQMQKTGRIEYTPLLARLVASGVTEPLMADIEEEDIGTGLVQAPLD